MSENSGEIVEVRRSDKLLSLEWKMFDPRLFYFRYESPHFSFCDERWFMELYARPAVGTSSEWMIAFILRRYDVDDTPKTLDVAVEFKGSDGVQIRKEVEHEFTREEPFWCVEDLCKCNLPHTITLEMKISGNARDFVFLPRSPNQADSGIKEPGPPITGSQSSDKQGESSDEVLVIYSYKDLQEATQNFSDRPLRDGGCKIGEGGFGSVYKAIVKGNAAAVKRLKDPVDTQFITELKTLTNYKHENLVPLLGCSLGPTCCLIYEYMPNGSLEDRLACEGRSKPLSWQTRLSIAHGSALGINHLHTSCGEPVVHRDIKSANILLDQNLVPKVGDFGLVRTGSSSGRTTMAVTEICCGTRGYMPREAHLGDVSVKWDTYSFGVVLLELLTGLPPYDPNRKHKFLILHMENCKDILRKLDPKADWNKMASTELYKIAQRCLAESKRSRPYISEILEDLRKLSVIN